MYKTGNYSRVLANNLVQKGINIIASNGSVIAQCKTQKTADKIIKGLELYNDEVIKRKNFRL